MIQKKQQTQFIDYITMTYTIRFWTLSLAIFFTACLPLERRRDAPIEPTATDSKWHEVTGVNAERTIQNLYATPFELLAITENQFIRLSPENSLIEKRTLQANRVPLGAPVLSENTFFRAMQGIDNREIYEFHCVRNAQVVKRFYSTDLVRPSETFTAEHRSIRFMGAYSADGTKYFLPGVVYQGALGIPHIEVIIFNIYNNLGGNDIDSVTLFKRVAFQPQVLGTSGKIESCRFMRDYFYLATADGGFRISPDGQMSQFFPHWTLDFFQKEGRIYATGFSTYNFFYTSDNGRSWLRGRPSNLRFTETVGSYVLSQKERGARYMLGDSTLLNIKEIQYNDNTNFPNVPNYYYGATFFQNKYYLNAERKLFYNNSISAQ
ncbi:MAG: hypothetical protein RLZZ628_555 [Bacteroidota bacterium]